MKRELFVEVRLGPTIERERSNAEPQALERHGSRHLQHATDRGRQPFPVRRLELELFPSGRGEPVEPCASSQLGHAPLGRNPPAVFQTMKCGVERPLADLQHLL